MYSYTSTPALPSWRLLWWPLPFPLYLPFKPHECRTPKFKSKSAFSNCVNDSRGQSLKFPVSQIPHLRIVYFYR